MYRTKWFSVIAVFLVAAFAGATTPANKNNREELLKVREQVWRAWFANDTKALEVLVPQDTLVISAGEENWQNQSEVLESAAKFQKDGGKLIRLEFPRTEVQFFGDVAVTYSKYVYETEMNGNHSTTSGRVTETFVRRNGAWTNPGWHTDTEK